MKSEGKHNEDLSVGLISRMLSQAEIDIDSWNDA